MAFDQSTTEAILKVYVTDAIIQVGAGGRGFLMETGRSPLVITAAQCLPHLPPSPGRHISSYGYANLLGPLGAAPTIWAECLFVDPIADVAVLCEPGSERIDEWDAFDTFTKDRPRLRA